MTQVGNPSGNVPAPIEQQQAVEQTGGAGGNHEPARERTETLWNDFWRIPLKDRLMIWLTSLLLIAGCITLWIFKGQLDIMRDTLIEIKGGGDQTERLVITGLGQMAVASRTATAAQQQAGAAQDSADAIERQTKVTERSWLGPTDIAYSKPPQSNDPIIVVAHFKNTGKTPAKAVILADVMEALSRDQKPDFGKEVSFPTPSVLFPGGEFFMTFDTSGATSNGQASVPHVSGPDIEALRADFLRLYVHGRIKYEDIFGCKHWTTFCYRSYAGPGFIACEQHNDTDRNQCQNPN
jgi:hypothetical protein